MPIVALESDALITSSVKDANCAIRIFPGVEHLVRDFDHFSGGSQ